MWQHIAPDAISPLRDAQVLNGLSLHAMYIDHRDGGKAELGYLVSNCLIRKAAYEAVQASPTVALMYGTRIASLATDETGAHILLESGERIGAKLLVAADSRFSEIRRAMGIAASMHDFGRVMMVCAMRHELPHQHVAWEWFDYGQTLALLPMNGERASVVVTLPAEQIEVLMQMVPEDFNRDMERRFQYRLGAMQLDSTRHAYPLVTVYPRRFVKQSFALSAMPRSACIRLRRMASISVCAAPTHWRPSSRTPMRATHPLFVATHFIAKLYSDESPAARLLRVASLRLGNRLTPFKRALARMLTEAR